MNRTPVSAVRIVLLLAMREWKRLVRQPARLVATILTPALIWVFISSGFARSIAPDALQGLPFEAFLLPGMLSLVVVFGSIFSSIPVIDDRQSGWLQTVLSSPSPRWSIALGLMIGGASTAFMQALVLLIGVVVLQIDLTLTQLVVLVIGLALTCHAMAALGLAFAWRSESTASFHSVMNLVIMPMWLLSGAFFPPSGASSWMSAIVAINPLTWLTNLMRAPLQQAAADAPPITTDVILAAAFTIAITALAVWVISQRPRH